MIAIMMIVIFFVAVVIWLWCATQCELWIAHLKKMTMEADIKMKDRAAKYWEWRLATEQTTEPIPTQE